MPCFDFISHAAEGLSMKNNEKKIHALCLIIVIADVQIIFDVLHENSCYKIILTPFKYERLTGAN